MRDRTHVLTYVALLTITAAAWLHVLWSMLTDDMAGMDMAVPLGLAAGALFVAGWTVMMTAMMLPSALPMIMLYAGTTRRTWGASDGPPKPPERSGRPGEAVAPLGMRRALAVAQFTLVYLVVWALTGVPAYLGSVMLGRLEPGARAYGVAGTLVVAGLFQLSPLKQVCLRNCRSPLGFLLGHWRPGWRGALSMGWQHALYCLGCCWALMVVLVGAGAMGLAWVLLIAAVVAVEKLVPHGDRIARLGGVALVLLGLAVAVRPELAVLLRGHPM